MWLSRNRDYIKPPGRLSDGNTYGVFYPRRSIVPVSAGEAPPVNYQAYSWWRPQWWGARRYYDNDSVYSRRTGGGAWLRCCCYFMLALLLCMILAGIITALVLTIGSSSDSGSNDSGEKYAMDLDLKLTNRDNDPTQYDSHEKEICDKIREALTQADALQYLDDCTVGDYRTGSLISLVRLLFDQPTDISKLELFQKVANIVERDSQILDTF